LEWLEENSAFSQHDTVLSSAIASLPVSAI
ncbi:hypothetical protein NPIL_697601, partial [Nephila pilipes]